MTKLETAKAAFEAWQVDPDDHHWEVPVEYASYLEAEVERLREQNTMLLEELESAAAAGSVDAARAKRMFEYRGKWAETELNRWRSYGLQLAARLRRMGQDIPPLPDRDAPVDSLAPVLGPSAPGPTQDRPQP